MNEVFRQERKFLITLQDYYKYSHALSKVMTSDKHNKSDGYSIRSLYFDSLDDRDFEEKEDGVEIRRKIRLRIYHSDDRYALLEMKQKQGSNQKKRSLRMKREDVEKLILGQTSVLLGYSEPFAQECYAMINMYIYRPKTIVEYQRKAFITKENNIRITFDHHLIGTESNVDIFSPKLLLSPLLEPYLVVLEVKYNHFLLSYLKDILDDVEKSEISVGKYALGRSISKHYIF